jgi:glutamate-1-semialdehyde aminotransferase
VQCDLACVGKALSNGMPLSALVGRRELMRHLPEVGYGMTFRGETFSLAAASAVLDVLDEQDVAGRLERTGERLRSGWAELCDRHGVPGALSGPAARMTFTFPHQDWDRLGDVFVDAALRAGVLTDLMAYPTLAHDDAAVDRTLARLEPVAARLAEELPPPSEAADDVDAGAGVRVGPRAVLGRAKRLTARTLRRA